MAPRLLDTQRQNGALYFVVRGFMLSIFIGDTGRCGDQTGYSFIPAQLPDL